MTAHQLRRHLAESHGVVMWGAPFEILEATHTHAHQSIGVDHSHDHDGEGDG